ncbi:DUF4350 domain-containing protein [Chitinophaga solisilvae]|uniref:DUF4350 domain-containing protein n=1 Tax=Chitinophaga solisilvae TaxID=1233460 RepID=UPI001371508D|nr:DUF4350 domain-containing protein [Chitinophaga solisilvae]
MKTSTTYYIAGGIGLLLIVLLIIGGLKRDDQAQSTDMRYATFAAKDKKAGGGYVAYRTLPRLFDNHSVQTVTKPFASTLSRESQLRYPGNAYILVSDQLYTTENDITSMMECVSVGNDLFMAVNTIDPRLGRKLGFEVTEGDNFQQRSANIAQHLHDSTIPVNKSFSYNGMIAGSYFSKIDTASTTVLGTNFKQKPNFIRIAHVDGFIYLSLNPYTFTNYFLLRGSNIQAMETQLSYIPKEVVNVYWDDFYCHQHSAQSGEFSQWQVLMRYPSLRWALWLAIALLLLYVIFEGKRRQRIIPDRPPLANTSLEFVDAIGQLYYQQHNNYNLAHKMTLHLLEYIRTRFYLNTNHLNEAFAEALSKKSALPESDIRQLLQMIHDVQLAETVSDDMLREYYKCIQHFYLNTK